MVILIVYYRSYGFVVWGINGVLHWAMSFFNLVSWYGLLFLGSLVVGGFLFLVCKVIVLFIIGIKLFLRLVLIEI